MIDLFEYLWTRVFNYIQTLIDKCFEVFLKPGTLSLIPED